MSAQLATQEKPLNSAWSREDSWVCTGVSVGCSFVNSSSKLLVSALPFCADRVSCVLGADSVYTYDRREVRGRDALVQDIVEVHVLEERMSLDLLRIALSRAESPCGVASEKLKRLSTTCPQQHTELSNSHLLQNRDGITRHRDGVQGLVLEDGVEDFVLVVPAERRLTEQHLIHEHTECPPVDSAPVALLKKNL